MLQYAVTAEVGHHKVVLRVKTEDYEDAIALANEAIDVLEDEDIDDDDMPSDGTGSIHEHKIIDAKPMVPTGRVKDDRELITGVSVMWEEEDTLEYDDEGEELAFH